LAGKIAFVTAVPRGIGRATALKLAAAGWTWPSPTQQHEEADAVCNAMRKLGRRASPRQADVSDAASVARSLRRVSQAVLTVWTSSSATPPSRAAARARNELETLARCMETNARA